MNTMTNMEAQAPRDAWGNLLAERWELISRKLAHLAEEVPAKDFESTPISGTRSVGAVLRHVAFWNQYVADSLCGRTANDAANELPLADYPDKASVLEALRRTAQDVATALGNSPDAPGLRTAETVVPFIEHTAEHYGQLVVCCRLMGIVPPASRG
jgi:uncharacterized damage-inducible protein DinB